MGLSSAVGAGGPGIDDERLVIAVVRLPLGIDLRPRAFAHGFAGDVVGIGHGEEQHK